MELPESVRRLFSDPYLRAIRMSSIPTPEELRCRIGRPLSAVSDGAERSLSSPAVTAEELDLIVERASRSSLYSHGDELRRGFLHAPGGVRIGLCGTVFSHDRQIAGIRQISSIAIRIPREARGCAAALCRTLCADGLNNTLILSPPGYGKTTLLRDLIRCLSDGGFRVAVADERGELSAAFDRSPGFDLGTNTDVLLGGNKRDAAMMLLRSMTPQVLAFDEITDPGDVGMISQAAGCGVTILATAHAADPASMRKRALYRSLLSEGIFETAIRIRLEGGKRAYDLEALA